MKYTNSHGKETLENGRSKLAVTCFKIFKPKTAGRLARLFVVNEILAPSPGNQVYPGQLLAISFPEAKINKKKYKWEQGEECQIEVEIKAPPRPPKTKLIYG